MSAKSFKFFSELQQTILVCRRLWLSRQRSRWRTVRLFSTGTLMKLRIILILGRNSDRRSVHFNSPTRILVDDRSVQVFQIACCLSEVFHTNRRQVVGLTPFIAAVIQVVVRHGSVRTEVFARIGLAGDVGTVFFALALQGAFGEFCQFFRFLQIHAGYAITFIGEVLVVKLVESSPTLEVHHAQAFFNQLATTFAADVVQQFGYLLSL